MPQILSSIFKLKFLEFLIARENFDVMQQNWLSDMSTKFYKPLGL